MNFRRLLLPAGVLAVIVTVAVDLTAFRSERDARACWTATAAALASAQAEIRATQARIAAAERALREPAVTPVAAKPKKTSAKPLGGDLAVLLAKNPPLSDLYLKSFLARVNLAYRPLFDRLGLAPAQIDQLERLLTNAEAAKMDLRATARSQGLPEDDPGTAAKLEQQAAQLRSSESELLGPEAAQQLQQFAAFEPLAPLVGSLAAGAALQSAPLSDDQKMQLLKALLQFSGGAGTPAGFDPGTVDWPGLVARSQSFLSAPQVEVLRAKQTDFEAGTAALALVRQFYATPPAP